MPVKLICEVTLAEVEKLVKADHRRRGKIPKKLSRGTTVEVVITDLPGARSRAVGTALEGLFEDGGTKAITSLGPAFDSYQGNPNTAAVIPLLPREKPAPSWAETNDPGADISERIKDGRPLGVTDSKDDTGLERAMRQLPEASDDS